MFLLRKNIILVPSDYDGVSLTKGLLSLDCYDNKTECTLRCYNLFNEGPLLLGISINNILHKIDVRANELKDFKFRINSTIKNGDEISVVLLSFNKNTYDILLWGSTQLNSNWKSTIEFMLENELTKNKDSDNTNQFKNINGTQDLTPNNTFKNFSILKNKPNSNLGSDEHNDSFANGVEYHSDNFGCDDSLKHKNSCNFNTENFVADAKNDTAEIYSYEDEKINELIDKVIDMTENRENKNVKQNIDDLNFYERINPQIEKMFANNKSEEILNEILPNSKFCKVEFEDGSGYYVFGIIYEDGIPKYLCYGLPAQKNSEPPKEVSNLYQWLPIDATDETGDGYYMMYQDAATGKNVSVEII